MSVYFAKNRLIGQYRCHQFCPIYSLRARTKPNIKRLCLGWPTLTHMKGLSSLHGRLHLLNTILNKVIEKSYPGYLSAPV